MSMTPPLLFVRLWLPKLACRFLASRLSRADRFRADGRLIRRLLLRRWLRPLRHALLVFVSPTSRSAIGAGRPPRPGTLTVLVEGQLKLGARHGHGRPAEDDVLVPQARRGNEVDLAVSRAPHRVRR